MYWATIHSQTLEAAVRDRPMAVGPSIGPYAHRSMAEIALEELTRELADVERPDLRVGDRVTRKGAPHIIGEVRAVQLVRNTRRRRPLYWRVTVFWPQPGQWLTSRQGTTSTVMASSLRRVERVEAAS